MTRFPRQEPEPLIWQSRSRLSVPARTRPVVRRAVFTPSPEQLVLPEQAEDLEGWLVAMLRTAAPEENDHLRPRGRRPEPETTQLYQHLAGTV